MTTLSEELVQYQLLEKQDIPHSVWDKARVSDGEVQHYRLDVIWEYISTMKSSDGYHTFKRIS